MADTSLNILSHYVGNWLVKGRFKLGVGKPEEADAVRKDLLEKLNGLDSGTAVASCVDYLTKHTWKTPAEVDAFHAHYMSVNPAEQEMDAVLKRLQQR